VSGIALLCCWLARERRWLRVGLLVLLTFAWTMPGPVIGIGLKEAIKRLVALEDVASGGRLGVVRTLLYDGPSPLPVMWASAVRFLPVAVILLWPAVCAIPRELIDTARVDGAGPAGELRLAVAPSVAPAVVRASLAVAALSLGELSAGKLVETPGEHTLAHEIFQMMHYGVERNLAAMCLILLGLVLVILLAAGWVTRRPAY